MALEKRVHNDSMDMRKKDPQSIISNRSVFKLSFFSPDGSTNHYVGIWYNTTSLFTVI